MTDFIKANTGIRTLQLEEGQEGIIIEKPFMLTDLIVTNRSNGYVSIIMQDDEGHTHIIKVIKPEGEFNHSF